MSGPASPTRLLVIDADEAQRNLARRRFTRLGYDLPPSGQFDEATEQVVTAFQRHWRQDKVDGVADGATRARLIALLRLAG